MRKYKKELSKYTHQIIRMYKHTHFGDDVSGGLSTSSKIEYGFTLLK